jgi:Ca2+/Na+ antiporter
MSNITKRFSRRTIALFWLFAVAIVIGILLAFEQIAILYVLATLALVVLMLIVAFDDLEKVDRDAVEGFAAPDKK